MAWCGGRSSGIGVMLPVLFALVGSAAADELDDARATAAELATLANVAAAACPGLRAKPDAVAGFLAHAEVSEADLATRYRGATAAAASAFKLSADRNLTLACAEVFKRLGDDGLDLVGESADPAP